MTEGGFIFHVKNLTIQQSSTEHFHWTFPEKIAPIMGHVFTLYGVTIESIIGFSAKFTISKTIMGNGTAKI